MWKVPLFVPGTKSEGGEGGRERYSERERRKGGRERARERERETRCDEV